MEIVFVLGIHMVLVIHLSQGRIQQRQLDFHVLLGRRYRLILQNLLLYWWHILIIGWRLGWRMVRLETNSATAGLIV
jgi:uncharacterized membrane protein (DUF485 family)